MGAWGFRAFDNDTACDWAWELANVEDLSLVESAFDDVEDVGDDYLETDFAWIALAACEVLARLRGKPGYSNGYTKDVDSWVYARICAHKLVPRSELLARASNVIDRILREPSAVCELCEGSDGTEWRAAMENLRQRLLA